MFICFVVLGWVVWRRLGPETKKRISFLRKLRFDKLCKGMRKAADQKADLPPTELKSVKSTSSLTGSPKKNKSVQSLTNAASLKQAKSTGSKTHLAAKKSAEKATSKQ